MHGKKSAVFEKLESRTFLSASALETDQKHLSDAVSKLAADKAMSVAVLAQDRAAVRSFKTSSNPKLAPLIQKLKDDGISNAAALRTDHANKDAALRADQSAVNKAEAQIRLDRKNPDLLTKDTAKLGDARSALSDDKTHWKVILYLENANAGALITADRNAIIAERKAGGASPEAAVAQQKLLDDSILWRATIARDQQDIVMYRNLVIQDKKSPPVQSTNLVGSFTGTVVVSQGINIDPVLGDHPVTFDVTSQTTMTLVGMFVVPDLNIDANGTFNGSIGADGKFSYTQTTNGNTITISGQENFNGKKLVGDLDFQYAGYPQISTFDLNRTV